MESKTFLEACDRVASLNTKIGDAGYRVGFASSNGVVGYRADKKDSEGEWRFFCFSPILEGIAENIERAIEETKSDRAKQN